MVANQIVWHNRRKRFSATVANNNLVSAHRLKHLIYRRFRWPEYL